MLVIENIKSALRENDSFKKVELFDPVITDEDVKGLFVFNNAEYILLQFVNGFGFCDI